MMTDTQKIMVWSLGGAAVLGLITWLATRQDKPDPKYGNQTRTDESKSGQPDKSSTQPIREPDWDNPYDRHYKPDVKKWLGPGKTVKVMTDKHARDLAAEIYEAYGLFNDDESQVEAVFKNLKDKLQVSQLADAFYQKYKKRDMYAYLKSFLDADEMEKYVHQFVQGLPNYRLSQ